MGKWDDIKEQEKLICEKHVYSFMSVSQIAKQIDVSKSFVEDTLAANSAYIDNLNRERKDIWKGKYKKMIKLSYDALNDILRAPHEIKELRIDKETGETELIVTGIDANLLKMKKDVAERVLEENDIIQKRKTGGINIDNRKQIAYNGDREKALEIEAHLEDCMIPDLTGEN